jgi:hypothetical protein
LSGRFRVIIQAERSENRDLVSPAFLYEVPDRRSAPSGMET